MSNSKRTRKKARKLPSGTKPSSTPAISSKAESPEVPNARCIAVIGDMVGSRTLGTERSIAQSALFETLHSINELYPTAILSKFLVTAGDEFQGLLKQASVLPDIIWKLEDSFKYETRLGIGCGVLNTPLQEFAAGMDGPAWYAAREAIKQAHKQKRYGGVFIEFDELGDVILNGFARILYDRRQSFTEKQRKVATLLREGLSKAEVAQTLDILKQSVHSHEKSIGWEAYKEAESAWRAVLNKYDFASEWNSR